MEGQFHCLKCGRRHNRSSTIGSFDHHSLDVERKGFDPEEVAVGIAFVNASDGRSRPDATIEEIEAEFESLGFNNQFPNVDVESVVREWKGRDLIGDVRHSGKHWFVFLANERTPHGEDRSPDLFHLCMKDFAKEFDRAKVR